MSHNIYIKNWFIVPALDEHVEMKNWLAENTDGKWCHWIKDNEVVSRILGVTLYNEQDAIMFKLKFGL
jgi:hypothetical protein